MSIDTLAAMYETIWIKLPDSIHRTYGIEILSRDLRKVRMLVSVFNRYFPRGVYHPFFQGGSHDPNTEWVYFEFWTDLSSATEQDALLQNAQNLADHIGLPLEIR